jgi:hypothetical protein
MKKAKIALVAIATLGVVGGAFAFKAKADFSGSKYFVTTVQDAIPTLSIKALTTTAVSGTPYWYTTVADEEATVSAKFNLSN